MRKSGFTLIELLVVIAIISMLASMLMPVYSRAKEKAREITCTSNQRQIGLAAMMYIQDHEEAFPDSANVWQVLSKSIGDTSILRCMTKGSSTPNAYVFSQALCGVSLGQIDDPMSTLMICDGAHKATAFPAEVTYDNIMYSGLDMERRHFNHAICGFVDGHADNDSTLRGFGYRENFETIVRIEDWSSTTISSTPLGGRKFLGPFDSTKSTVSLTLNELTNHSALSISFDLLIMGNWTGNTGPCQMLVNVASSKTSQNLFASSFSTATATLQSYPGDFPASNPGNTGAMAVDTLGYTKDAVYHISGTASHSDKDLIIRFISTGLSGNCQWGIDNLEIVGQ